MNRIVAVIALPICGALRAANLEVWLDQSELSDRDAWDQKIQMRSNSGETTARSVQLMPRLALPSRSSHVERRARLGGSLNLYERAAA